jgi:hypothetical protein
MLFDFIELLSTMIDLPFDIKTNIAIDAELSLENSDLINEYLEDLKQMKEDLRRFNIMHPGGDKLSDTVK